MKIVLAKCASRVLTLLGLKYAAAAERREQIDGQQ